LNVTIANPESIISPAGLPEMLTMLYGKLHAVEQRFAEEQQRSVHDWIVVTGNGLPVDFQLDAQGRITKTAIGLTYTARRFSHAEATRLAANCYDGTGAVSRAQRIDRALAADVVQIKSLIRVVEAHVVTAQKAV